MGKFKFYKLQYRIKENSVKFIKLPISLSINYCAQEDLDN